MQKRKQPRKGKKTTLIKYSLQIPRSSPAPPFFHESLQSDVNSWFTASFCFKTSTSTTKLVCLKSSPYFFPSKKCEFQSSLKDFTNIATLCRKGREAHRGSAHFELSLIVSYSNTTLIFKYTHLSINQCNLTFLVLIQNLEHSTLGLKGSILMVPNIF